MVVCPITNEADQRSILIWHILNISKAILRLVHLSVCVEENMH